MRKIGFIGLGTMGGPFAVNLCKAGFDVVVHDLERRVAEPQIAAGAEWADSPRAVAEAAEVVLTSLPGPAEVQSVALDPEKGLIAGMSPGAVCFDLSTNSPTVIRSLHARFADHGLHLLDAPVSGGPKGAKSGKLAIWVGGDREVFEQNRAVLDALGDQVRYIGEVGAGSVAKLVHNSAGYAVQCAMAEVFTLGVKAGVEPLALWEAVRQGARGRQRTFDSLADHFLSNNYDPADFALKLAHKDVALAAELGRDIDVPMRFIDLTRAELAEALNRGWGERDSRVAMLLQQERAGVDIEVKPARLREVLDRD